MLRYMVFTSRQKCCRGAETQATEPIAETVELRAVLCGGNGCGARGRRHAEPYENWVHPKSVLVGFLAGNKGRFKERMPWFRVNVREEASALHRVRAAGAGFISARCAGKLIYTCTGGNYARHECRPTMRRDGGLANVPSTGMIAGDSPRCRGRRRDKSNSCRLSVLAVALAAAAMMVEPAAAFLGGAVAWFGVPRQARPALFSSGPGRGRVGLGGAIVMLAKGGKPTKKPGTVAENKQARFNYQIDEKFECGLVLQGTEVKSCRAGKCNIGMCFQSSRRASSDSSVPTELIHWIGPRTQ